MDFGSLGSGNEKSSVGRKGNRTRAAWDSGTKGIPPTSWEPFARIECEPLIAGFRVPDTDETIFSSSGKHRSVDRKGDTVNPMPIAFQREILSASAAIPEVDSPFELGGKAT
jgi:hypothetical protein